MIKHNTRNTYLPGFVCILPFCYILKIEKPSPLYMTVKLNVTFLCISATYENFLIVLQGLCYVYQSATSELNIPTEMKLGRRI